MKTKHIFTFFVVFSLLCFAGGVVFAEESSPNPNPVPGNEGTEPGGEGTEPGGEGVEPTPNSDPAPGDEENKPAPTDGLENDEPAKSESNGRWNVDLTKNDDQEGADPVGIVTGVVRDRELDFIVRCPGIDLVFQRAFDGEFAACRDLPEGWCHNYEWRLVPSATDSDWMVLRALSNPGGVSAFHHFQRLSGGGWGVSDNAPFVLTENNDGTWTMKAPGPVLYRFGQDGWLDSITARTGETILIDRGADREHVLRVSHSCGRALVFQYGTDGVMSSIRADDGTALEFEQFPGAFDAAGRMVSWTNEFRRVSGGNVSRMRYVGRLVPFEAGVGTIVPADSAIDPVPAEADAGTVQYCREPIVRKIDEDGAVTTYVYRRYMDSLRGRVVFSSTDDGYYATRFDYGIGRTEERSPLGDGTTIKTFYTYDPFARRILSQTRGDRTIELQWSVQGDVVRETSSDTGTGSYLVRESQFGAWHNATNVVSALDSATTPANAWRTEWESGWLLPTWKISPEGRVSGTLRDNAAHTLTIFGAGPNSNRLKTVVQCDDNWKSVAETNANGAVTLYDYNAAGELVRVRRSGRPTEEYANDELGHRSETRLPGPGGSVRVTAVTNNSFGKPLRIDHPDGTSESFAYDNSWRLETEHTDELGRTDRYENYLGTRLHAGRIAAGSTNEIPLYSVEVGKQLNLVAIIDPMGRPAERYILDDQARVSCVTNLEGQTETFRYRLGNLVDRIDRFDGTSVSYDYDSQSRVSAVSYPGETRAFSYDRDGLLLSASNSAGTVSAVYDATGWATNVVGTDGTEIAYGYHDGGQVATVSSVAGTTTYDLDEADRLATLSAHGASFDFAYCDWNGLAETVTTGSGLSAEYAYDLRDRVTNVVYRNSAGSPVSRFGYERDALGRITVRSIESAGQPSRRIEYGYDALDRLVSETETAGTSVVSRAYVYDLAGNRLSATVGGVTTAYAYDNANRLQTFGAASYTHDAAGCVTGISGVAGRADRTLVWNSQYQLVSVSAGGNVLESYTYDAFGRRATTTTAAGTVRHVYDGSQCIADLDEQGNVLSSYVWGPGIDNLLAIRAGGATYYALTDHQNTVHGFVDASGIIVARYAYDAWGNVLSETVTASALAGNRYRFQGREYSALTGLYNFRARWYDPMTGRWLSKDPLGLNGGINLYEFCKNTPANFVDPSGLKTEKPEENKPPIQSFWPPKGEDPNKSFPYNPIPSGPFYF